MFYKENMELKLLQFKSEQLRAEVYIQKKIDGFMKMLFSGIT